MTNQEQSDDGLLLPGLDGANPLAFLAALGTLRGLTLAWPERQVRLSWTLRDTWRPRLQVDGCSPSEDETLDGLEHFMEMRPGHGVLEIGDDLTIPTNEFREHAWNAVKSASPAPEERAWADFIAAFGCDAVADSNRKGHIQDTALRTMSGAGHQHFLKTMRELGEKATRDNLQRCLFYPWSRSDALYSLRWDPEDDRRYAHRWRDPGKETAGTEWGANRLAFEALPLLPVMPVGRSAITTGFSGNRSHDTFWIWPIWKPATDLDTVRSLLALRKLQEGSSARDELAARGVGEVFKAQRINVGQYRSFTPSTPA